MKGTPPFGYRYQDGKIVKDPDEQETIKLVMSLRKSSPVVSYGNIAADLNRRGILNRGKFWNPTTLWYIVKREAK